MILNKNEREKVNGLEMIKKLEENTDSVIKIYSMCSDKKEYRKIIKVCSKQVKIFKKYKNKTSKFYSIEKIAINENLFVETEIKNYLPESINDNFIDRPIEIKFNILNNDHCINICGSSYYGGCNESEAQEYITILKNGVDDIKYIEQNKDNDEND